MPVLSFFQLWVIRNVSSISQQDRSPSTFPRAVILENITSSPTADVRSGTSPRLDVTDLQAPVAPVVFTGRDSVPNKIPPPALPRFEVLQTDVPNPPVLPHIQQPRLEDYIKPTTISLQGPPTSHWQVISIGYQEVNEGHLLFNPSTGLFLGNVRTSLPNPGGGNGLPMNPNGTPIVVADTRKYLHDMAVWKDQNNMVDFGTLRAAIIDQLRAFVWFFQRADLGPKKGQLISFCHYYRC